MTGSEPGNFAGGESAMDAGRLPETYRDCLDFLYARNQFAIKLGLDNIKALLGRLGRPQDGLRILHVAGTNGKGSVCANLAALLRACGYGRVGLYTSPHLVSFRERILVDGEPVAREWIVEWMRGAMPHILELGNTYFEIVTAMALDWFRRRGCEAVVLETGLGGRLDATNAVRPEATAITSVSLDHTQILGDTVEAIWREKIGILKPGVPMVVAENRPRLLEELRDKAREAGSPVIALGDFPWSGEGGAVRYRGRYREYVFPADLRGEAHQRENLALSLLVLEAFLGKAPPPDEALLPFLREARVPGRTQLLTAAGRLPVLLDGAHNPGGVEALARYVCGAYKDNKERRGQKGRSGAGGAKVLALVSMMKDKDAAPMLRAIAGFAEEIRFVPLSGKFPRAATLPEMERALAGNPSGLAVPALAEFPLEAAALEALTRADAPVPSGPSGGPAGPDLVVVCGSLYLIGEIIPLLVPHYPGLAWFRQFEGEG
jgi:dihydrofolate synthase/folylpolyglutamate synthase